MAGPARPISSCHAAEIGELLGHEDDRPRLLHRITEEAVQTTLHGRVAGPRRALVGPGGQTVGVDTGMTEAAEHVGDREGGEITEPSQAEAAEQLDELGVGLAEDLTIGERTTAGTPRP